MAGLIGMWVLVAKLKGFGVSSVLSMSGLTLTALGASSFAFGYGESMALAATGFGSHEYVKSMLKAQARVIRFGLGLVFLGTVLQGAAQAF